MREDFFYKKKMWYNKQKQIYYNAIATPINFM